MVGEDYGDETAQEPQAPQDGDQQATQGQPQVDGMDWEAAEALRGEIAQLKEQGEEQRIDFELRLAGVRNVKAARAVLADHGDDVDALKEAEPWLFADAPASQKQYGQTGLPNAGTSTDNGKTMARWRRLAGLDDEQ